MLNTITYILSKLAYISGVLPFLVALIYYKKYNLSIKFFSIYVFFSFTFSLVSIITLFFKFDNLYISNIYQIIEFIFIVSYYQLLRYNEKITVKGIIKIIGISSIVSLLIFYLNSVNELVVTAWGISNLIIACFILAYLIKLFTVLHEVRYASNAHFWISIGLLIYFAGTVFLFLSTELFISEISLIKGLWNINNILVIITNIFLTLGLWKARLIKI